MFCMISYINISSLFVYIYSVNIIFFSMFCFVDHAELSKRYTNSLYKFYLFVCFMVFNATFNNISVISL